MTTGRVEKFRSNIIAKLKYLKYKNKPNLLYGKFFNTIKSEFNAIFTSKTVNSRNFLSFNDWATVGIQKSRQRLYELYSEKTYNHSESFNHYVRVYSKLFKKVCAMAKSLHIKNQIKNSFDKIKMT